jgi:hypothetical protein
MQNSAFSEVVLSNRQFRMINSFEGYVHASGDIKALPKGPATKGPRQKGLDKRAEKRPLRQNGYRLKKSTLRVSGLHVKSRQS